jgi:hypothetical protein
LVCCGSAALALTGCGNGLARPEKPSPDNAPETAQVLWMTYDPVRELRGQIKEAKVMSLGDLSVV